jgi:hypothetical protein
LQERAALLRPITIKEVRDAWRSFRSHPGECEGRKESGRNLGIGEFRGDHQGSVDQCMACVANGTEPSLRRVCETICRGNTFEAVAREFFSVLRAAGISAESPSPVVADLI